MTDRELPITSRLAFGVEHAPAGRALGEGEKYFRDMIDALPAAIYTTDAEGRLTHFNRAAVEFSGRVPVLGSDQWCVSWKLYYPDGRPMPHDACPMAIALKEGRIIRGVEAIAELPDGKCRWFMPYPTPIRDAAGRIVGGINMLVDITEKKLAEDEARRRAGEVERLARERARLVDELSESHRRKDEFLAMLSHELRNPLAPIRTAVELLRTASGNPAVVQHAQGILERQVTHMVALVDDLLDVSRISNGNIALDKRVADLADIVRNAVELSRPGIDAVGHHLELRNSRRPVSVFVDPVRIAQIIANLLNNSARYTPPGGKIVLEVTCDEAVASVSVRDNGTGIEPELLPRIFDMFVQGVSANRPTQGGLGIGLPLARRLAEMHHGTLEGSSEGVGRGSEFVLRIPLLGSGQERSDGQSPAADMAHLLAKPVDSAPLQALIASVSAAAIAPSEPRKSMASDAD